MRDESLNAESDPSLNIEKPRKNSTGKNSKNTQQEEKKIGDKDQSQPRKGSKEDSKEEDKPIAGGDDCVNTIEDVEQQIYRSLEGLKPCIKALKEYGLDWIYEWLSTHNFKFWLEQHQKIVAERSQNWVYAKGHFWYYQNGDIYLGELQNGNRQGKGQFVDRHSNTVFRGDWV